jgi:hypothetical protein
MLSVSLPARRILRVRHANVPENYFSYDAMNLPTTLVHETMTGPAGDLPEAWERPVFLITTGRSGSTLLLRYLNCAERMVVWGEHAGIVTDLAACYRKLRDPRTEAFVAAARPMIDRLLAKQAIVCPAEQMTVEWANSFDGARVRAALRAFLVHLLNAGVPADYRWGFKEIHYADDEMALLRSLFAAPRFVLLVRDPASILKSKFRWFAAGDVAQMPEHVEETITFLECAQREVALGSHDVALVHYEHLVRDPLGETARLAHALDCTFLTEQVRAIAAERRQESYAERQQENAAERQQECDAERPKDPDAERQDSRPAPDAEANLRRLVDTTGLPLSAATFERLIEAYRALTAAEAARRQEQAAPKPQRQEPCAAARVA